MAQTLSLTVVSQERQLIATTTSSLTVPTTEGEVTILPGHVPLFASLETGELRFKDQEKERVIVISAGFLNVAPNNEVTIMTDSAVHEREISLEKAQAAVEQAKHSIATAADRRELILAEASLKRALLEIQVAEKTRRTRN